jgi:hypothetical protein
MIAHLIILTFTVVSGSSSIKISDDKGSTYTVNADDISSGCEVQWRKSLILLLATTVISYLML